MNDSVEYKKHINLSEAEKAMSIINVFYEERCNGLESLSKTLYDILVDSKNTICSTHPRLVDFIDENCFQYMKDIQWIC